MKQTGIFLIILFLAACSQKEKIQPKVSSITESVYASGIVKTEGQYQVFSDVAGILENKLVNIGDTVKKGASLFKIQSQTAGLDEESARLNLQLTEENMRRLENMEREADLAKKKMEQDQLMYERQQNLWNQGVGTKVDLEQKRLAYQSSRINYQNILEQIKQTRNQLRLEKERARTNLEISKERQDKYTVRSEIAGRVYDVYVEEGEAVNPQKVLAIVGKPGNFLLEVQVDENDIVKVKNGQTIFVNMDSYKDTVFKAVVTKVYPIMNERTGTFTVEGVFTEVPPRVFPNMNLEANILIQTRQNALIIPREYLVDDQFVLNEKGEKIRVETGVKNYEYVEIVKGLNAEQYIYKP